MRTPGFAAPSQHSDFCASFKMHPVWRKVINTPIVPTWRTQSSVSSSRFCLFQTGKASHTFISKNMDSIYGNHVTLVCHLIGHADACSSRRDIFENWLLWQINKLHWYWGLRQIRHIGNKRPLFKHHLRSQVSLDIFPQIADECGVNSWLLKQKCKQPIGGEWDKRLWDNYWCRYHGHVDIMEM